MATMIDGPVVLDGIVSDEKLAELLALGTEYAELDFKRMINPRRPERSRVHRPAPGLGDAG